MHRNPVSLNTKVMLAILIMICFALLISVSAYAQDNLLMPGIPVTGILDSGASATYTFEGTIGDTFSINLASDEFDPVLKLLDSDGTLIGENDDFEGFDSQLGPFGLIAGGIYQVQVSSFDNGSAGEFTISLNAEAKIAPPSQTIFSESSDNNDTQWIAQQTREILFGQTTPNHGLAEIEFGKYVVEIGGDDITGFWISPDEQSTAPTLQQDYEMQIEVNLQGTADKYTVQLIFINEPGFSWFTLSPGKWNLSDSVENFVDEGNLATEFNLLDGQTHILKAAIGADQYRFSIDGRLIAEVNSVRPPNGFVGFGVGQLLGFGEDPTDKVLRVEFDNLTIQAVAPPPAETEAETVEILSPYTQTELTSISQDSRTLFLDDFATDRGSWDFVGTGGSAGVTDGAYVISLEAPANGRAGYEVRPRDESLQLTSPFELELEVTSLESDSDRLLIGLGFNDRTIRSGFLNTDHYLFYILEEDGTWSFNLGGDFARTLASGKSTQNINLLDGAVYRIKLQVRDEGAGIVASLFLNDQLIAENALQTHVIQRLEPVFNEINGGLVFGFSNRASASRAATARIRIENLIVQSDPATIPIVTGATEITGPVVYDRSVNGIVETCAEEISDYSFEGHVNELVDIALYCDGTDICELSLYGPDTSFTPDPSIFGGPQINNFRLPATGDYRIEVRARAAEDITGFVCGEADFSLSWIGRKIVPQHMIAYDETFESVLTESFGTALGFEGHTGDVIAITMNSDDDLDAYLELLDSDGNPMTHDDDAGEGYLAQVCGFPLLTDDMYSIVVRTSDIAEFRYQQGRYQLMLETLDVPVHTFAYNNVVTNHTSNCYGDLWYFDGQAGDVITIAAHGNDGFVPTIALFNANDDYLALDYDSGTNRSALIRNLEVPATGQYYIRISDRDGGTGSYKLSLTSGTQPANRGINLIQDSDSLYSPNLRGTTAWQAAIDNWTQGQFVFSSSYNLQTYFTNNGQNADMYQDLDVSALAQMIDAGSQLFDFQAQLVVDPAGVFETRGSIQVIVEYRDENNAKVLDSYDTGPLSSFTEWDTINDSRTAPVGTRWIRVHAIATQGTPSYVTSISLYAAGLEIPNSQQILAVASTPIDTAKQPSSSSVSLATATSISPEATPTFAVASVSSVCDAGQGQVVIELSLDELTIVDPEEADTTSFSGGDESVILYGIGIVHGTGNDAEYDFGANSEFAVQWTGDSYGGDRFNDFPVVTRTLTCGERMVILLGAFEDDRPFGDVVRLGISADEFMLNSENPPSFEPETEIVFSGRSSDGSYEYRLRYTVHLEQA